MLVFFGLSPSDGGLKGVAHRVRAGEFVLVIHVNRYRDSDLLGVLTAAGYGLIWQNVLLHYADPVRVTP